MTLTVLGAARFRRDAIGRVLAALAVTVVAVVSLAGAASAHTVFNGSDPPDGAALAAAPATISLDFSEDLDPGLARVQLTDGAGHRVTLAPPTVDEHRPTRLVVTVPALPPETYRLSFSIRDSVDLHETASSIVFGVGTVPNLKSSRPVTRGPNLSEVALRWLARSGLAVLLGSLAVMLLVLPGAIGSGGLLRRMQRTLLGVSLLAAAAALAGDTALLCLQAAQIGPLGSTLSRVISQSEFGRRWLIGAQLAAGLVVLLGWLRGQSARGRVLRLGAWPRGRRRWSAAGVACVLACALAVAEAVAVGFSGHTGSASSPTGVGIALRAAHLLAAGAWVGGLVAVLVVLRALGPVAGGTGGASGAAGARGVRDQVLRRFSPVAAIGLLVVVVTGLLLSGTQVATVTALLSTRYGAILLVKVVAVGVLAVIGLHHFQVVRSRSGDRPVDVRLRRTLPLEAAGGIVVILLGAALGATAPARGPQFSAHVPAHSPSTLTVASGDLLIRLSLQPNRPGRNLLAVDVFNTRRPAPAPIDGVVVKLTAPGAAAGGTPVTTSRISDSSWDGGAVNLAPGDLTVKVSVARSGRPEADASVGWVVNGTDPWRQPTVLSAAPLAPLATGAAIAVAFLSLVVFLLSRRPGGRRRPEPSPAPGGSSSPAGSSAPRHPDLDEPDRGGGPGRLEPVLAERQQRAP